MEPMLFRHTRQPDGQTSVVGMILLKRTTTLDVYHSMALLFRNSPHVVQNTKCDERLKTMRSTRNITLAVQHRMHLGL